MFRNPLILLVLFLPLLVSMSRQPKETSRMSQVEFLPLVTFDLERFMSPQLSVFQDCDTSMLDTGGKRHKFSGFCSAFPEVRYGQVINKKYAISLSGFLAIVPYRLNGHAVLFKENKIALILGSTVELLGIQFGYGGNLALEYDLSKRFDIFATTGYRSYRYDSFVSRKTVTSAGNSTHEDENRIRIRHQYLDVSLGGIYDLKGNSEISVILEFGLQDPFSSKVLKDNAPADLKAGTEVTYRLGLMRSL